MQKTPRWRCQPWCIRVPSQHVQGPQGGAHLGLLLVQRREGVVGVLLAVAHRQALLLGLQGASGVAVEGSVAALAASSVASLPMQPPAQPGSTLAAAPKQTNTTAGEVPQEAASAP